MSGRHTRGAARFGNWTSLSEGLEAFGARLDADYAERVARLGQENAAVQKTNCSFSVQGEPGGPKTNQAPIAPARSCQWITSEKPLQMCGRPSQPRYSWCAEHLPTVFWRFHAGEAAD